MPEKAFEDALIDLIAEYEDTDLDEMITALESQVADLREQRALDEGDEEE